MSAIVEANRINKKVQLDQQHELHILKDMELTIEKGNSFRLWDHPEVGNPHCYIMSVGWIESLQEV